MRAVHTLLYNRCVLATPLPPLIELPFRLPGRVFRSPMPFSPKDPGGKIFSQYQALNVSLVVVLAEEVECLAQAGRDLPRFYTAHGMEALHLPTPDFGAPPLGVLRETVEKALAAALAGQHIAVHCYAGYGRTGMFLACLARRVFGITPEAAILWVREAIPGAIEAPEQRQAVEEFPC